MATQPSLTQWGTPTHDVHCMNWSQTWVHQSCTLHVDLRWSKDLPGECWKPGISLQRCSVEHGQEQQNHVQLLLHNRINWNSASANRDIVMQILEPCTSDHHFNAYNAKWSYTQNSQRMYCTTQSITGIQLLKHTGDVSLYLSDIPTEEAIESSWKPQQHYVHGLPCTHVCTQMHKIAAAWMVC